VIRSIDTYHQQLQEESSIEEPMATMVDDTDDINKENTPHAPAAQIRSAPVVSVNAADEVFSRAF